MRDALVDTFVYRQFLDHVIGTLGSLSAQYQPVIDLESGRVEYCEALLRIESPLFGSIRPASFLLLIEQLGVMRETTHWVIDRVSVDLITVANARVFVNLPEAIIGDGLFVQDAADAVGRIGVGPGRLGFEVACDAIIGRQQEATDWLASLHEAGFAIAVDRCGHDDLSRPLLASLPVEYVKFALSPGAEIVEAEIEEYTKAVARLGSAGIRAIAVGIEDEPALAAVKRAGFHCGQGFVLGHPETGLGSSSTHGRA